MTKEFCAICLKADKIRKLYRYKKDLYICRRCVDDLVSQEMSQREEWYKKMKETEERSSCEEKYLK